MNDEDILVPANAVFHPLSHSYKLLFRTNTSGLASGNEVEEAIFHGLSEVIERDAWSLVEASRNTGPIIQNVGDGLAGDLLDKFSRAEVAVYLKDITSDIGIPTCAAVSDDTKLRDPTLLTTGMGTHTCAGVAVLRALTEVAQSRLTQIHGAREDTTVADFRKQIGYDRTKRLNKHWFDVSRTRDFAEMKSYDTDDFLEDIRNMTGHLEEAGLERAIVVDLTREEIGVPVVRVIVPGLEISAVDSERVGGRVKNARNKVVVFLGPSLPEAEAREDPGCRLSAPGQARRPLQSGQGRSRGHLSNRRSLLPGLFSGPQRGPVRPGQWREGHWRFQHGSPAGLGA